MFKLCAVQKIWCFASDKLVTVEMNILVCSLNASYLAKKQREDILCSYSQASTFFACLFVEFNNF